MMGEPRIRGSLERHTPSGTHNSDSLASFLKMISQARNNQNPSLIIFAPSKLSDGDRKAVEALHNNHTKTIKKELQFMRGEM